MNVVKWYKVHQMLLEVLGNILKNYSFFKISLYELVADLGWNSRSTSKTIDIKDETYIANIYWDT